MSFTQPMYSLKIKKNTGKPILVELIRKYIWEKENFFMKLWPCFHTDKAGHLNWELWGPTYLLNGASLPPLPDSNCIMACALVSLGSESAQTHEAQTGDTICLHRVLVLILGRRCYKSWPTWFCWFQHHWTATFGFSFVSVEMLKEEPRVASVLLLNPHFSQLS